MTATDAEALGVGDAEALLSTNPTLADALAKARAVRAVKHITDSE